MSQYLSCLTLAVLGVLGAAAACASDPEEPNPNGKDEGAPCSEGSECRSLTCRDGKCTAYVAGGNPTDKVKNGAETDVDCGGRAAPACADGKACAVASDCASAICTGGTCRAPSPNDGIKNGDESDVDCGGTKAPKCGTDKPCNGNADCQSDGCSHAKKCAPHPSCTGHFGGDTCGPGETGEPDAKHESCCTTVTNDSGLTIGKYLVTAGRMRAFIERYSGNLKQWAATSPKAWKDEWTEELPSSIEEANELLGPARKRGCSITTDGKGTRTYFLPPFGQDKNDYPQDVLDEKVLNCVPWHLAQALCAFDGGRLPTNNEIQAMISNNGQHDYPWQFHDDSHFEEQGQDDRLVSWYSYTTPNPPADIRKDNTGPLDRSFWVPPPGRRPKGANAIGVQDALGAMLNWVNDEPFTFAWTMSWEEHERKTSTSSWPTQGVPRDREKNGYYAIGARCVFE